MTDKSERKAQLALMLQAKGWTLFGYSKDRTDWSTDYYCPAYWFGVATRGDLLVLCDASDSDRGRAIMEWREHDEGECPNCKGSGVDPSGWTLEAARAEPQRYGRETAPPGSINISSMMGVVSPIPFREDGRLRCRADFCREGRLIRGEHVTIGHWPTWPIKACPSGFSWSLVRMGEGESGSRFATGRIGTDLERALERIEAAATGTAAPAAKPETVDAPELRENAEMHGLEIRFPSRPPADVLERLKSNGWRWSRRNGCWYRKDSQPARIFAEALVSSMSREVAP